MAKLRVNRPGQLSLIQDFGRYGITPLGVTQGGPVDEYAYCWANHLLGNPPNCTSLEITLGQAEFTFSHSTMIAICGGDLRARLDEEPLGNWRSLFVRAGQTLRFGLPINGLRAYLAVLGGFQVAKQLGSSSCVQRERLGGLHQDGQPLQLGDQIDYQASTVATKSKQVTFRFTPDYNLPLRLRVIEGYQATQFDRQSRHTLYRQTYHVSANSDRMGYRLEGAAIKGPTEGIISEPIALGAIQIPPDGQPIILLNDRQTLGGYPKLGMVARIDHPRLAQAKSGQEVRFIRGNRRQLQAIWCDWALRFGY